MSHLLVEFSGARITYINVALVLGTARERLNSRTDIANLADDIALGQGGDQRILPVVVIGRPNHFADRSIRISVVSGHSDYQSFQDLNHWVREMLFDLLAP
jgi:hypothetical protein